MPGNKKSRKKAAGGVSQGDTQDRSANLRRPSQQPSPAQSKEGTSQANLGGKADERASQRTIPRRNAQDVRGAISQLQRAAGTEQTASESPPSFGDAQRGIGETREAGGTEKAPTNSSGSSSDQGTCSSSMQSLDSMQDALENVLFTDYTYVTGHVTISGRLTSSSESLLKKEDDGSTEQVSTARCGGRDEDMGLIKLTASNRATSNQIKLFQQKIEANDPIFNTRVRKALETYGVVSAMAEIAQLKLFIAIQAVDRLAKSILKIGRCPGCRNSKCKRSIDVEHVAHPYQQTDLIDQVADNLASFKDQVKFSSEMSKAAFLLQVNNRLSAYHSHAMYDRSAQLRLTLFRDGIFDELRWTAQEVDFIEGHDVLLKECAESTKLGAPQTGRCGPGFTRDRTPAEASRGSPGASPPEPSAEMQKRVERAADAVLRGVFECGRSREGTPSGSPTNVVEFTCDGITVTTVRGARGREPSSGSPSSMTARPQPRPGPASSAQQMQALNATQELRRLAEKVKPQNAFEAKQKLDLLTATTEDKCQIPEIVSMHRSLLEKWVQHPATAPQVLQDHVLPRERAYLTYRFNLEREINKRQITPDRRLFLGLALLSHGQDDGNIHTSEFEGRYPGTPRLLAGQAHGHRHNLSQYRFIASGPHRMLDLTPIVNGLKQRDSIKLYRVLYHLVDEGRVFARQTRIT